MFQRSRGSPHPAAFFAGLLVETKEKCGGSSEEVFSGLGTRPETSGNVSEIKRFPASCGIFCRITC